MVDANYMAQIAAQQKQNELAMAEQMRKMGLDPTEFMQAANHVDPELAELEKMLNKPCKLAFCLGFSALRFDD